MISSWEPFDDISWSLWDQINGKKSLLLNFEILVVFVKTITADDKYSVWDCENMKFPIQMEVS